MINNNVEYIASSASWYDDKLQHNFQNIYGIPSGFVVGCYRHSMCPFPMNYHYKTKDGGLKYPSDIECEVHQGFITSYGRYVSRIEALKIAIDANQVKAEECGKQLYSEDIFTHQTYNGR